MDETTRCSCGGKACVMVEGDRRHGTPRGYCGMGCRCQPCLEAGHAYRAGKKSSPRTPEQRDRYRSYNREWRKQNSEVLNSKSKEKYASDPERYREAARQRRMAKADANRAYHRAYSKSEAGRLAARAAYSRRRARRAGVECGCVNQDTLREIWDMKLCAYCGDAVECVDHLVPIARGGWNCVNNLVPACMDCNGRKHAASLEQFLTRYPDRTRPIITFTCSRRNGVEPIGN